MLNVIFHTFFRSSEETLRSIFSLYGVVQTCIVNVDKRHAFVKMLTRGEAQVARDGMERYRSPEMQLRVGPPNQNLLACFNFFHQSY